jgi:hypothetical protein
MSAFDISKENGINRETGLPLNEHMALSQLALAFKETDDTGALNEQMNIVRLNKAAKIANQTSRTALLLAKNANDPLYAKYAKFNGLRLQIRAQIFKKYNSKATSIARKLVH